jgi:arylsulfatase A-like enzyme
MALLVLHFIPPLAVTAIAQAGSSDSAGAKPNILWFVVDDMSANFSCYGEQLIDTPNVDRLAREGVRFTHAFVTAPVCSPARSALITGMYQTSIGAHHHRSGRGVEKIHLPEDVQLVPEVLQQAGYYTCIGSGLPNVPPHDRGAGLGKTDYNFQWKKSVYNGADWAGRKQGQPFFMQVQLPGGKLRGNTTASAERLAKRARRELGAAVDPQAVTLPPYYPHDAVLLRDWAAYLDAVRFTDRHVGRVVERLEAEGELDNTLIIFITDHGISHARGKQFLYNEGTHIPLVIRGPGVEQGATRDDLVEHIDVAAITLAAAGVSVPTHMHAQNILARDYKQRDAVFAARDRCDETVERIRSVRTDRYLYIRNFHPDRPHLQPNQYKDSKSIVQTLRSLHAAGDLEALAESLLFSHTRPQEELYDWIADPWQTKDLAADAAHDQTLRKLRTRLDRWMMETNDQGAEPESMYDSDMAVYVGRGNPTVEQNIALMRRWAAEGK